MFGYQVKKLLLAGPLKHLCIWHSLGNDLNPADNQGHISVFMLSKFIIQPRDLLISKAISGDRVELVSDIKQHEVYFDSIFACDHIVLVYTFVIS